MRIKSILFSIAILFCCSQISAQSEPVTKSNDFDFLLTTIKSDYPGYADKYTPEIAEAENNLKAKAIQHPDSCIAYMKQYLELFKDNHLRIDYNYDYWVPIWINDPVNQPTAKYKVSVPAGLELLNDHNSIEGLWTGFKGTLAVFNPGNGKYVGVWLNGDDTSEPRDVSYEFTFAGDSLYASVLEYGFSNRQPASLELDGQLLEIHSGRGVFVRPGGSEKTDRAFLESYIHQYPDPRSVNIYNVYSAIDEETFFIRMPDFDPDEKENIEKALDRHWDEITSRPNLIVDLRMNGGGQDDVWDKLFSLIYTKPFYMKFVEWYATQSNIESMERDLKNNRSELSKEDKKWMQDLIKAMKANVGGFVIHPEDASECDEHGNILYRRDGSYGNPKNIGIIIDGSCGSSTEEFLLACRNSDKNVVFFGRENTSGTLDYSNATPRDLPGGKYVLYVPMTRSMRLPENPIDGKGIAPDVIIPYPPVEHYYDRLDQWVYFVRNYLRQSE